MGNITDRLTYKAYEGTLIFSCKQISDLRIYIDIYPEGNENCKIRLNIEEQAAFYGKDNCKYVPLPLSLLPAKKTNSHRVPRKNSAATDDGYKPDMRISYWLSFNRDDRELKYGQGYIMEETTLVVCKINEEDSRWNDLFNIATMKCFEITLGGWKTFEAIGGRVDFYPYPLIKNWPHLVKDSAIATIEDIADNKYILSACLPATCQDLYAMVASENVKLESWLSNAIEASLENGLLRDKLNSNNKEGKGDMSNYLRITLGVDHGSSPGIPFILEIWPRNAGSAIHNHGNAYGIVKVLKGQIDVSVYNKTWGNDSQPISEVRLNEEENKVAWLSPNWFQTHKLKNPSDKEFCATLQCYKYGDNDRLKYPFFDYLDTNGYVEAFKPKSDFDFNDMKEQLRQEFEATKTGKHQ